MSFTGNPKPFNLPPLTLTATATLAANAYNVIICNAAGNITVNLPNLESVIDGFIFMFTNINTGTATLTGAAGQLIGPANTVALGPGETLNFVNDVDAGKWQIELGPISASGSGPLPDIAQIVYVNKGGNDVSGEGTIFAPFLTIGTAMTSITDASTTKRYQIEVGPGTYTENVVQKDGTYINGSGIDVTTIAGTLNINQATWSGAGAKLAGISNLTITGAFTVDYSAQSVANGSYNAFNVSFTLAATFLAFNAASTSVIKDCVFNNNLLPFGGVCNIYNSVVLGTVTVGDIATNSSVSFFGGSVNILAADGDTSTITLNLLGVSVSGTVTLDNSVNATATPEAIPVPSALTLTGAATLTRLNEVA